MLSPASRDRTNALEKPLPFKTHPQRTSWLVLHLFNPKATGLNITDSEPKSDVDWKLLSTASLWHQAVYSIQYLTWYWYLTQVMQKNKGKSDSPGILGTALLDQRTRRMNWLNYPRKKSCLLRASVGSTSQTLAPEHRCRVSETQCMGHAMIHDLKPLLSSTVPTCLGKILNSSKVYAPGRP